jgi:hypothetical protein
MCLAHTHAQSDAVLVTRAAVCRHHPLICNTCCLARQLLVLYDVALTTAACITKPTNPTSGTYLSCPSTLVGGTCTATCTSGFLGVPAPTTTCVMSGTAAVWSTSTGTCARCEWGRLPRDSGKDRQPIMDAKRWKTGSINMVQSHIQQSTPSRLPKLLCLPTAL